MISRPLVSWIGWSVTQRQAAGARRFEEETLEVAARQLYLGGDERGEGAGAVVAGVARDHVLERALVVALLTVGLREEPLDAVARLGRREVEGGAGDGRGRDAADARDVAGIEGACAVGVDAGSAAQRSLGDDVDRGAGVREEVQGGRGAAARQCGARPAREKGGHPSPLGSQARMAVREHTAVQRPQAAIRKPCRDRPVRDAQVTQLATGHHTPLAIHQREQGCVHFGRDAGHKGNHLPSVAMIASQHQTAIATEVQ